MLQYILPVLLVMGFLYYINRRNKAERKEYQEIIEDFKTALEENNEKYKETQQDLNNLQKDYNKLKEKHDKMVSNQKSKEVRLGAIAETLTPFLEGFPYNPKNLRALGSPIDYISFEKEEITFIEVKSGDSRLSERQKNIKELIESGKIKFEVHRIRKDGLEIK